MSAHGLAAADRGSLVLTDVSGYTGYLLGTELEHAQDVLADLTRVVLANLQPVLHVSKLEGDAIFDYALDGACGASTLLDTIERTNFAFRSRQRDIAHATSCTCAACRQIPTLDLKFSVHHGSFVRRELAGNEELTGRDVIVVHRLVKNTAAEARGTEGYVLLTDACVERSASIRSRSTCARTPSATTTSARSRAASRTSASAGWPSRSESASTPRPARRPSSARSSSRSSGSSPGSGSRAPSSARSGTGTQ